MELDRASSSNASEATYGSFFDTLQGWALNFVQLVFEPLMDELQRPSSTHERQVSVIEPSKSHRYTQEKPARADLKYPKGDFPKVHDIDFPLKKVRNQSSQTKMLADAAFILSNVSSCNYNVALFWFHIFFAGSACRLAHASCVVCAWLWPNFAAVAQYF